MNEFGTVNASRTVTVHGIFNTIGVIGDVIEEVSHKVEDKEYDHCDYCHKRSVEWIKKVDSWQDIYLFKSLRAQQTISDITEDAKLVFRNLFPVYFSDESIHISFHKSSQTELGFSDNIKLQVRMLEIMDLVAEIYNKPTFSNQVNIKTAVGSPGFIEMILPGTPIAGIFIILIMNVLLGKYKGQDGSLTTGISAIIASINSIVNDYHNRKKVDAETDLIKANIRLTDAKVERERAESEKIKAEAALIQAQTQKLIIEMPKEKYEQIYITASGKTNIQEKEEQELLTLAEIEVKDTKMRVFEQYAEDMYSAAIDCELMFDGKRIKAIKSK